MDKIININQAVHKDQLRAIIKECGFQTTPDTFWNLKKNKDGLYSHFMLGVKEDKAFVLSPEEQDKFQFSPQCMDLHEILGPKVITGAAVAKVNPLTGQQAEEGHGFMICTLHGSVQEPVPVGKALMHLYEMGHTSADAIATSCYRNALVDHYQVVKTEVDCGYRWTDSYTTRYCTGHTGDGTMYKDMKAFDEKEGICYISGEALAQQAEDISNGIVKPAEEYGYTYTDLVNYARMNALRNPEQVARHCLQNITWQSPFTELDEFHNCCDIEDLLELDEEIQDLYDLFIEECGVAPNYADVYIEYEDGEGQRDIIALNPEAGEYADDEVVFTCSNFEEFKKLADKDCKEDFRVMEIYCYSLGSMDNELKTQMTGKSYPENPGMSAPIIDNDIDTIDGGATLITSEEKEIPWYEDLSRISDVNVFRNPMNKDYVEFRMRCKIDGEQMLGRVITSRQVEELANGADRKEMAARVFAREMTLNNPLAEQKNIKL